MNLKTNPLSYDALLQQVEDEAYILRGRMRRTRNILRRLRRAGVPAPEMLACDPWLTLLEWRFDVNGTEYRLSAHIHRVFRELWVYEKPENGDDAELVDGEWAEYDQCQDLPYFHANGEQRLVDQIHYYLAEGYFKV